MENIQIDYQIVSKEELSDLEQALVKKAIDALAGAHAPYSNFKVGSAVQMEDGTVVSGNNQENAAYPSGLCAERVALFAAKSQTKQPIKAITIVAKNQNKEAADAFSCGNCRQVMMEYANEQNDPIKIIMGDHEGKFIVLDDVRKLLPFSFYSKSLK
ncbi:MAG: cytidine deaminase [Flammeovirgaceae bacterium]|nr:cytidine deaminase [Flammeovirgaceae bacterium]MBE63456.1 cytidine deaminase [Flammeovirgaceae bacterium]MBR06166.1 cytidine deaminase [Rickettsiales bacterium]HCX20430.1 cytidine deaminase [Cytophagales bacterium]|tara:strand:- start:1915 stop:2385 length:471 start_codon:yes stop_codon:yes gene_type:complete